MVATKAEDRQKIVDAEPKWYAVVDENFAADSRGRLTAAEQEALAEWNDVFTRYKGARPKWFELYGAGRIEEAAEWRAQTTTPWGAGTSGPTLSVAISCVGRRLVLGERTEEELEATLDVLPSDTRQIGFYSYGELSPLATGTCELHNQTMTHITLGEE